VSSKNQQKSQYPIVRSTLEVFLEVWIAAHLMISNESPILKVFGVLEISYCNPTKLYGSRAKFSLEQILRDHHHPSDREPTPRQREYDQLAFVGQNSIDWVIGTDDENAIESLDVCGRTCEQYM
jgi:hypothetical protein